MFKLEAIWDKQAIAEHIMNSYNENMSLCYDLTTDPSRALGLKEAWSIQMIIYQYVHTLRKQYCKYYDTKQDVAFEDLKGIISHHIVGLVVECRALVKSHNFDIGKSHNQQATRPYNNDGKVDNIFLDSIVFSDVQSMESTLRFIKSNSTYLKMIYKEIATIVCMLYEGDRICTSDM